MYAAWANVFVHAKPQAPNPPLLALDTDQVEPHAELWNKVMAFRDQISCSVIHSYYNNPVSVPNQMKEV